MTVIASSRSLPLPSEPTNPTTGRPRSNSHSDVVQLPPRYSSLAGTISPSAAALLSSVGTTGGDSDATDIAFTAMRPPRYSSVFQSRSGGRRERTQTRPTRPSRNRDAGERDASVVSGSGSSTPLVHESHLKSSGKAQPWATLKVFSRSSTGSCSSTAQKMPLFTSRDLVQGCLDLNLESPQTINSITLSLRGRIITSAFEGGCHTFLDQPVIAWTRANGDPRSASPPPLWDEIFSSPTSPFSSPGSASSSSSSSSSSTSYPSTQSSSSRRSTTKKFEGKLSGDYSWPFSFHFPTEIGVQDQAHAHGQGDSGVELKTYPIPQTFLERGTNGSVQYELVLRMTHGMLRADSKLTTSIVYVPDTTPSPSSVLRQLAYSEGVRIPGPQVDPFGWHTLPPSNIRGKLLNERNVKLQCSLSLANPRSYTRGTVIPLHFSIRSSDIHALDVLANPKTIAVRLTRRVQYYKDAAHALSRGTGADSLSGALEDVEVVEKAVWWFPAVDSTVRGGEEETMAGQQGNTRYLEGEIHLEKDLQPSCGFLLFDVSHAIELLPFYSPIFKCSTSTLTAATGVVSPILVSHPVIIATLPGEGPTPIAVTERKPRKERPRRALEDITAETSSHMVHYSLQMMPQ